MTIDVSSAPISLRIAVIGLGGIGSTFAFQLAVAGGHDVTTIARPGSKRFRQLNSDAGIVDVKGRRADVGVADTLDENISYDLLIVTLLAHQVDAILPALKRCSAKTILFMFNNFDPERLRDEIGGDRCAFGMPFVQAHLDTEGKLKAVIGAARQKTKLSERRLVDIFQAAGLPAVLEPSMMLWLRCHVPLCIAFESVSVAGVRHGNGASWREAVVLARGVQECFKLIRGLGYEVYPSGKSLLSKSPAWMVATILWSMSRIKSFRELLATGMVEARSLVDVIVAAAPDANPPILAEKILAMKPSEDIK